MKIRRVFEPSHIRRGRMAVDPTWYVDDDVGMTWRFHRRKDAKAFVERGGCPEHDAKAFFCDKCEGRILGPTAELVGE